MKLRRRWKVFWNLAVIFTLIVVVRRWDPPFDDSDMRVERVEVPAEQNAYFEFVQFMRELQDEINGNKLTTSNLSVSAAGAWPEGNSQAEWTRRVLNKLEFILKKPHFQPPVKTEIGQAELASTATVRPWLFTEHYATAALDKNRPDEATQAALIGLRLAAHLDQARTYPSVDGHALQSHHTALRTVRNLANSRFMNEEQLRVLLNHLNATLVSPERFATQLRKHYQNIIGRLEALNTTGRCSASELFYKKFRPPPAFADADRHPRLSSIVFTLTDKCGYLPNRTKKLIHDETRSLLARVGLPIDHPDFAVHGQFVDRLTTDISSNFKYLRPNFVGESQFWPGTISLEYLVWCRDLNTASLTRVMLALRLHQLRHGSYPQSLAELCPDDLPAVPMDWYDGEPIRYDPHLPAVFSAWPLEYDGEPNINTMLGFPPSAPPLTKPSKPNESSVFFLLPPPTK